jgi:hypothetical protein
MLCAIAGAGKEAAAPTAATAPVAVEVRKSRLFMGRFVL